MQWSSAFKIILVLLNQQIEAFDTKEGKWPNITHRWSVKVTDSNGRKSYPTFTEITSALDGPCAPWGTLSTSCADTECVAGLKCSPGTVTPTLPSASFVPTSQGGSSSPLPRNPPGETEPLRRFLKYWLRYLLLPPKVGVLLLVFPAPIPEFVTAPQLYVLRRLAALGLEGLLLAFRTFSVTLLRFLLSDPSLDPGSDEVFSFSLLLGFSVVFPKLPEGAKTETGPK